MIKLSIIRNLLPQVYILFLLSLSPSEATEEKRILIYNAASTSDTINEISKEWEKINNIKVNASSASSSSLAKQIINGAPANIYISASWLWIEELKKNNIIVANTIKPLFENKLVLIANKDSNIEDIGIISNNLKLKVIFDKYLNNRRISIADPTHVPAGIYTQQALLKLNLWNNLNRNNMAWGGDVRRTLKFVALGNSPIGIVYYTDALAEKNVKIIGTFDTSLHKPIHYWVAGVKKFHTLKSKDFLNFLNNEFSKNIYTKHGFKKIENK